MTRDSGRAHLTVRIRRAVGGDLEQFAENVQSVADEGKYIFTEEVTAERKKSIGRLFKDKDSLVIVAEVGAGAKRRIVGSLTLARYGDVEKAKHVRVLAMLVVRRYRGLGIGKKLMARALEWANAKDEVEKIILGVFSTNQRAFRLYEKFGFEVEGVKKKQYHIEGKHADEIEMALFLKRPSSSS
jgi:RimJ/RimL family protein N-acetyltransferase